MKKSAPFVLPKNFPPHAPLPPGGPWIRPAREDDWDDEVTVAFRPPPESSPRQVAPESTVHASRGRSAAVAPVRLGIGLAPSLTPLALVEARAAARRSA